MSIGKFIRFHSDLSGSLSPFYSHLLDLGAENGDMRNFKARLGVVVSAAAMAAGVTLGTASSASAVAPGGSFQYGNLSCSTSSYSGNGTLTCSGTQNGWWRAKVTCNYGGTYYASDWKSNYYGGSISSTAYSSCWWGVRDITISVA